MSLKEVMHAPGSGYQNGKFWPISPIPVVCRHLFGAPLAFLLSVL
jgi:hypothetical protein